MGVAKLDQRSTVSEVLQLLYSIILDLRHGTFVAMQVEDFMTTLP